MHVLARRLCRYQRNEAMSQLPSVIRWAISDEETPSSVWQTQHISFIFTPYRCRSDVWTDLVCTHPGWRKSARRFFFAALASPPSLFLLPTTMRLYIASMALVAALLGRTTRVCSVLMVVLLHSLDHRLFIAHFSHSLFSTWNRLLSSLLQQNDQLVTCFPQPSPLHLNK